MQYFFPSISQVALESFYDNPEPDDVEDVPAMSGPPPASRPQAPGPSDDFAPKPAPAGSSWGGGSSQGSAAQAG